MSVRNIAAPDQGQLTLNRGSNEAAGYTFKPLHLRELLQARDALPNTPCQSNCGSARLEREGWLSADEEAELVTRAQGGT